MNSWEAIGAKLSAMWNGMDWTYAVQLIAFAVLFYIVFKVLKENKSGKFIAILCAAVIVFGIACSFPITSVRRRCSS